jgi:hypothetical protein
VYSDLLEILAMHDAYLRDARRPRSTPHLARRRSVAAALALKEYESGHLTKPELRRLLGFETREALDGFLKDHEVFIDCTLDDLEEERRGLHRLGF